MIILHIAARHHQMLKHVETTNQSTSPVPSYPYARPTFDTFRIISPKAPDEALHQLLLLRMMWQQIAYRCRDILTQSRGVSRSGFGVDLSTETGHGSASKGLAMLVLGVKRDTHRHTIHIHSHPFAPWKKSTEASARICINNHQLQSEGNWQTPPFQSFPSIQGHVLFHGSKHSESHHVSNHVVCEIDGKEWGHGSSSYLWNCTRRWKCWKGKHAPEWIDQSEASLVKLWLFHLPFESAITSHLIPCHTTPKFAKVAPHRIVTRPEYCGAHKHDHLVRHAHTHTHSHKHIPNIICQYIPVPFHCMHKYVQR